MNTLTPNERLTGSGDQRAEILARLARFRDDPRDTLKLAERYPHLKFATLNEIAPALDDTDCDVFETGVRLVHERFAVFGVTVLLPLDRVFVGIASTIPAHGGFHQNLLPERQSDDTQTPGYRYVQAAAVITRYGDLYDADRPAPGIVGLDLVHAYAHDSFHWSTFRSYRLGTDGIHRNQHGLNFRRENGRTYSARDAQGSASTRNLGIIMEGAFDREARELARATAFVSGIQCPAGGIDRYAYLDGTGAGLQAPDGDHPWLDGMNGYERAVNGPYAGFLAEIGGPDQEELHGLIIRAALGGDLDPMQRWLDGRYGPGEFSALFRSPGYALG